MKILFLLPLLHAVPSPNASSCVLLLRQDGDDTYPSRSDCHWPFMFIA